MAENTRPRTMDGGEVNYDYDKYYLVKTFGGRALIGQYEDRNCYGSNRFFIHESGCINTKDIETSIELNADKLWQMIGGEE